MEIKLKLTPNIEGTKINYVQTVKTNINWKQATQTSDKNLKGIDTTATQFVDPFTSNEPDIAKFYYVDNSNNFYDMPGIPILEKNTGNFEAETSIIFMDSMKRVATFKWGFSVSPEGVIKVLPLIMVSTPSDYHQKALNSLNIK
jgi:hypothetical protein